MTRNNANERRLQKLRYDRRRAAGRCVRCPTKAVEGSALCDAVQRQVGRDRLYSRQQKLAGIEMVLTELPKPSKPLNGGGIKRDYLIAGWCPPKGSIALGLILNTKDGWR